MSWFYGYALISMWTVPILIGYALRRRAEEGNKVSKFGAIVAGAIVGLFWPLVIAFAFCVTLADMWKEI